jgi:hypothetical protein
MGFGFRKRKRILPGFWLNFSKRRRRRERRSSRCDGQSPSAGPQAGVTGLEGFLLAEARIGVATTHLEAGGVRPCQDAAGASGARGDIADLLLVREVAVGDTGRQMTTNPHRSVVARQC